LRRSRASFVQSRLGCSRRCRRPARRSGYMACVDLVTPFPLRSWPERFSFAAL